MDLPSFPNVDLFAAGINALNGALIAVAPKHNRGYTVIGILIMGFIGGIGGGITRDVLVNDLPGPLIHASFLSVCLLMGLVGLAVHHYAARRGERFRTRMLAFVKSFTLPWFAILGAHKAIDHDLGISAAIIVGVIATTAGGVIIDLISGVTPSIVVRAEHLVVTAILAAGTYAIGVTELGDRVPAFYMTLIAAAVAFAFRVIAVRTHWEEILPKGSADAMPPGQIPVAG